MGHPEEPGLFELQVAPNSGGLAQMVHGVVELPKRDPEVAVCHMELGQSGEIIAIKGQASRFFQMFLSFLKLALHECGYESQFVQSGNLHG